MNIFDFALAFLIGVIDLNPFLDLVLSPIAVIMAFLIN